MRIKELNKRKVPIVIMDESLNKYNDVVLFPEKLSKANKDFVLFLNEVNTSPSIGLIKQIVFQLRN